MVNSNTSLTDFTKFDSPNSLEFWFDSTKEAQDFKSQLTSSQYNHDVASNIIKSIIDTSPKFVKHKTRYRKGVYWPLEDIDQMLTTDQRTLSSKSLTDLISWQHHDYIITNNGNPILAIETTDHVITWNNVAQRLPRMISAAKLGIPSVIFQKIGDRSLDNYKGWYLQTLVNATKIYKTPSVAILFDDSNRLEAEEKLSSIMENLMNSVTKKDKQSHKKFESLMNDLVLENKTQAKQWYDFEKIKNRKWIAMNKTEVKVIVGVKPTANMWKTKGTGGLDPYPGLVVMSDFLLCRSGSDGKKRNRKLTVKFKLIKEDFWWFKKYPTELYLQMLIDPQYRIADNVEYLT